MLIYYVQILSRSLALVTVFFSSLKRKHIDYSKRDRFLVISYLFHLDLILIPLKDNIFFNIEISLCDLCPEETPIYWDDGEVLQT